MECHIVSAPYHLGRPGISMGNGPVRILNAGLREQLERDGHRTSLATVAPDSGAGNEIAASFSLQKSVALEVAQALKRGAFPITLTGNCNTAAGGTIAGLAGNVGIIWLDGHSDFATPETTTSGFFDGMGPSIITGSCWTTLWASVPGHRSIPAEHVVLVGARSLDTAEQDRLDASAIRVIPPDDVIRRDDLLPGILDGMRRHVSGIYLHIDLDVLDPGAGQANAWATAGGLTPSDVAHVIALTTNRIPVLGLGMASFDPSFDRDGVLAQSAIGMVKQVVAGRPD